jgi:hypothetical protein
MEAGVVSWREERTISNSLISEKDSTMFSMMMRIVGLI